MLPGMVNMTATQFNMVSDQDLITAVSLAHFM